MVDRLERDVVDAARGLLGWELSLGGLRARIVETEAYHVDDPACHAFRGRTRRNDPLYGAPGTAYVYFTYGNHWMLNVVACPEGVAAAVLFRAAEPLAGIETFRERRVKAKRDEDLLNGPGKLAQAFGLDGTWNGHLLLEVGGLRLEQGDMPASVLVGPRIGISQGLELPWRFVDGTRLRWVSRPLAGLRPG